MYLSLRHYQTNSHKNIRLKQRLRHISAVPLCSSPYPSWSEKRITCFSVETQICLPHPQDLDPRLDLNLSILGWLWVPVSNVWCGTDAWSCTANEISEGPVSLVFPLKPGRMWAVVHKAKSQLRVNWYRLQNPRESRNHLNTRQLVFNRCCGLNYVSLPQRCAAALS